MAIFHRSLGDWRSERFRQTLKGEIEGLEGGALPLQRGATRAGLVNDRDITASILGTSEDGDCIRARVGVFFSVTLAGCSCGDEPSPENDYCEIQVTIDKTTAEARFALSVD